MKDNNLYLVKTNGPDSWKKKVDVIEPFNNGIIGCVKVYMSDGSIFSCSLMGLTVMQMGGAILHGLYTMEVRDND